MTMISDKSEPQSHADEPPLSEPLILEERMLELKVQTRRHLLCASGDLVYLGEIERQVC